MTMPPSDQRDRSAPEMARLLVDDPEGWARLQGLFAMLALPPLQCGGGLVQRRIVEVEITKDRWLAIEGAALDQFKLTVWTGSNGTRRHYEFLRAEGIPRWRMGDENHVPSRVA